MNTLKILTVSMILSVTALMADYTVFVTKSIPYTEGSEKEIFFGTLADYSEAQTEIAKNIAEHGTIGAINGMSTGAQALARGFYGEGLKYVGAGAAIGIGIALLDPIVMDMYADQEYILVKSVDLGEGRKALRAVFFVGDKHPSLSAEQIHSILRNK
ncbi:hypothetical protein [Hydrogenimonas cancrithermarum]|uniref:Uncharacterized protein n=1 Tax=Hydrogenimonas cancrithermarum TaxID=2993563 RepID=A0ABM8FHS0_9BACT|nr:hypothetical protein [Hydrogenimonas cancrithermarum]BDY11824.1 hypothetical protein HCR_01360 [Hydrogenimonas cancrithermarum]